MIYQFPQPGSIPGIPGIFAGVEVEVADDGLNYTIRPLVQQPHLIVDAAPAVPVEAPVEDAPADSEAPPEQPGASETEAPAADEGRTA